MKIISNDYANVILEYYRKDPTVQQFADDPLNIIDEKFGVAYIPVSEVSVRLVRENGFAVIPNLYGLLDTVNLEDMGVTKVQGLPYLGLMGEGVLLGFVDTGIDYTNTIFQNEDKTTRIVSIWDQTVQNVNASDNINNYGIEYTREQINEALKNQEPLSIVPTNDEIGHGTMLAGIAAGSRDETNNFQGVVPKSEIVVVKLKQAKRYLRDYLYIPEEADCYQEDDIMFGIKYLISVAVRLNKPIVICIGLGTSQGGHDGTDTLSQYVAWEGSFVGRAIIAGGGNEGNRKKHFYGLIDDTLGYQDVELMVGENENGFFMELWGKAPAVYSIDVLSPGGQYVPQILPRLGEGRTIQFIFEGTTLEIDYLIIESQTGDPLIFFRFEKPASGLWKFRVYARGSSNISFHIWLPMSSFIKEGTFFPNSNPDTTLTNPGNTRLIVTITAYNSNTHAIYNFASRGYTRINNVKPDVAAPGVNVQVPAPGNRYLTASGTSIATAYAAGVAAMIFEWGIVRGNYYSISSLQIQRFFIRGVEQDPANTYPNQIWGYGTINIYNTFLSLTTSME